MMRYGISVGSSSIWRGWQRSGSTDRRRLTSSAFWLSR
jgi:hypothetical protein